MPARLIIGALSGWKYHGRRERCIASWMSDASDRGIQSVFLMGCATLQQAELTGPHYLCLPCPDDYPHLTQRTWQFCRWALQQSDWDYLFKCDDDTYVSIPRLADYDLGQRDYVGAEWTTGVNYGSGGAGYFLSRRAAALVAAEPQPTMGAEDAWVGEVLRRAGIRLSIETRLLPWAKPDLRPTGDNDLLTAHGICGEVFDLCHAETGLQGSQACPQPVPEPAMSPVSEPATSSP